MALFEPDRAPEGEEILGSDAATRALSVTVVENAFVARVYENLAWVYDPTGGLAYLGQTGLNFMFTVNGVPQNIPDKKQMGALLTMKTKISIGSGQTTDDGFTGKMDELRIWKVARSAQQIADNYKLILKGDEPGLVAYYHFDDGAGTTPKDASSAHHDAAFNTDAARPVPTWVDSTDLVLTCKP